MWCAVCPCAGCVLVFVCVCLCICTRACVRCVCVHSCMCVSVFNCTCVCLCTYVRVQTFFKNILAPFNGNPATVYSVLYAKHNTRPST